MVMINKYFIVSNNNIILNLIDITHMTNLETPT